MKPNYTKNPKRVFSFGNNAFSGFKLLNMDVMNITAGAVGHLNDSIKQGADIFSNIWIRSILCILWSCVFILTVILNIVALIVFYRTRHTHASTKVFLASLTAADLGIGFVYAAPTIFQVSLPNSFFGERLCSIQAYVGIWLTYGALFSLLGVNVERFIAVVFPLHYPSIMTFKKATRVVCLLWCFATCYCIAFGFLSNWKAIMSIHFHQCFPDIGLSKQMSMLSTLFWASTSLFVLIVFVIMCGMYCKVFVIAQRHNRRLQYFGHSHVESKTAKTVFIILSVFIICWLPGIFMATFLWLFTGQVKPTTDDALKFTAHLLRLLTVSNSWLDTLIYASRNEQFRKELSTMFSCKV